jgi:hypothetical protein
MRPDGRFFLKNFLGCVPYSVCQKFFPLVPSPPPRGKRVGDTRGEILNKNLALNLRKSMTDAEKGGEGIKSKKTMR